MFNLTSLLQMQYKQPKVVKYLEVSFIEALTGCIKTLDSLMYRKCPDCLGNLITEEVCCKCKGQGYRIEFGCIEVLCDHCKGTGFNLKTCNTCKGTGSYSDVSKIEIEIPSGSFEGDILSIPDKGVIYWYQNKLLQEEIEIRLLVTDIPDNVVIDKPDVIYFLPFNTESDINNKFIFQDIHKGLEITIPPKEERENFEYVLFDMGLKDTIYKGNLVVRFDKEKSNIKV